jgi:hypothetical protein
MRDEAVDRRQTATAGRHARGTGSAFSASAVALSLLLGGSASSQEPAVTPADQPATTSSFTLTRASGPIVVDGALDEAAWATAAAIPVPFEFSPGDNVPAPVETTCLVTFDDNRLYVGFRAGDPRPAEVRAHFADRDTAFDDDQVGFLVDPFHDGRRAYQFRSNALGVQMDAINDDVEQSEDFAWDAIWESAARRTADGYQVEIAIPFRQLRFPTGAGVQSWGFMAIRQYPRSVFHRLRSIRTDRDRDCFVCQFQTLSGFSDLRTGRHLEVTPTVTGALVEARAQGVRGAFRTVRDEVEPGATARWGVTPSTFLSGTLNPDFSQVEADAAQLDVNQRFALFFPEKRPFFLEGADFFDTAFDVVFTRTVADPEGGLKLTAKQGRHAVGAYAARDRLNNVLFPGPQGSELATLDGEVTSGVARYRLDLGATSSLGALYTGREGEGYASHTAGFDGLYRFRDTDQLRYQVLGSTTRYPDEIASAFGQPRGSFNGHAAYLRYQHNDRNWFWHLTYSHLHPRFRADSGFMPQVGIREASTGVERHFWGKEGGWYTDVFLFAGVDATREWNGEFREWGSDLVAVWRGARQSVVELAVAPNREHFDGVDYDNLRFSVYGEVELWPNVVAQGSVNWGETIDFANNQQADFVTWSPGLSWRLGRRLEGRLDWDRQSLDVPGGRLLTQEIVQARLLYHFDRRTYLRAILQHRDTERDPSLFPVPAPRVDERLFTQLLFSYKLNAQTVFLLGYSDNHFGRDELSLTQTDRTLFLKIGYAWLL